MTCWILRVTLGLHAVLVTALLALFVVLAVAEPGVGANIGAGLVLLLLLGLGLPWSLPSLLGPDALAAGPFVEYLAAFGPALLNIGIHALVPWLLGRRRAGHRRRCRKGRDLGRRG